MGPGKNVGPIVCQWAECGAQVSIIGAGCADTMNHFLAVHFRGCTPAGQRDSPQTHPPYFVLDAEQNVFVGYPGQSYLLPCLES